MTPRAPTSLDELRVISSAQRAALPRLRLYIDPEACICCAACEPACPVEAIFDEDALTTVWRDYAIWRDYAEVNARFFGER